MFYTGKGDSGDTSLFGSSERVYKDSVECETLGALDELNSFIGFVKDEDIDVNELELREVLTTVQQSIFTIQGEFAGAETIILEDKVQELEDIIAGIEKNVTPVDSFILPGTTKASAEFDVLRTLVRKVERRVVTLQRGGNASIASTTLTYLNRLSSFFYALARLAEEGGEREVPTYE